MSGLVTSPTTWPLGKILWPHFLISSGEAKLSFRQYNGEKYYGVKDNIFRIYSKDNYSGKEKLKDYIVNESLINAFKEIEIIIKSNLNFFFI